MPDDLPARTGPPRDAGEPPPPGEGPRGEVIARTCWCGATTATKVGRFDPAQDATAHESQDSKPGPLLVKCDDCGVFALFPQPTDDELAAAYSKDYYGASGKKFIGPVAAVVRAFQGGRARTIARRVPAGGRVLDIGCGNGGFLRGLQQRGYVVEGTEWSAKSAARVPPGITVHVGDLLDLDLPPASYDAITLWHVFEHLRRPFESLLKIKSLLRPDGWLIMAVPNAAGAQARRYGTHWFHHDPPRHLFGFGPASLTRLLDSVGFRIHGTSTFSFEQNPFGEIQSALNARGSFPRDQLYDRLKGLEPQGTRLFDFARMATLLVPALVRSTIESVRNDGASLMIEARLGGI